MNESLTKQERLKKSSDISRVFSRGRKTSRPGASLYWIKNDIPLNRLAITLPRKFGHAVERNKTKRWIREVYRKMKGEIHQGYDLVIVAYPGEFLYADRKQQITSLLKNSGLLGERRG